MQSHPYRVFVVEDSALVRERLERLVSGIAGAVLAGSAEGSDEAIRTVLERGSDAVLIDIALAQGNGFQVLRRIVEALPAIDAFVVSNSASEPYRLLAMKLGAADFFDKSTEVDRLKEVLIARASAAATLH